jgi:hypothetical protein
VNATPAYLFRKVADPNGAPTILFDEIDTVFGPKAKDNEDIRGMLNAGHRKGAKAGRCVIKGKIVETEELDAYCPVALAGLDDLPDTIMTRSVVVRMRRRAPNEVVEPWRRRINGPQGETLSGELKTWASQNSQFITWPEMPEGVEDRNADVWEALLAVADLAGGDWPQRGREAAVKLVSSTTRGQSIGVMLLRDLRAVFKGRAEVATDELLRELLTLDESPWNDLRGAPLDSLGLARMLGKYDVHPGRIRIGGIQVRGYRAAHLADSWTRYLPPLSPSEAVTPVTPDSGCDCPNGDYGVHRIDCDEAAS